MTDSPDLDAVRAVMAAEEPVDLPEGLSPVPAADGVPPGRDPHDPGPCPEAGRMGGDLPPAPPGSDDTPPPEARCAGLPLNDHGNGQRFAIHFGNDALWVPRVGWFTWDGRRWRKDPDEIEVRRLAQQLGALIALEIPHLVLEDWQMQVLARARELRDAFKAAEARADGDSAEADAARAEMEALRPKLAQLAGIEKFMAALRKDHRGFARTSGNTTRIDATLKEGGIGLARAFEALDADPLAVACENGVLRFRVDPGDPSEGMSPMSDVQLVPHERDQLITKIMPVAYDPGASAPQFQIFLRRIQPDPDLRGFLQRWFGLSLTALTGEQKLVFLHGMGANGKSVLVDLMARMMGEYSSTAKIESLTGKNRRGGGDATPDLVPLMGARMVRASEPEEGERLQEGIIKELTGGEPILIRALHSDFIETRPVFKLTISGNHKPEIRGQDDGIWRRVLLVPFDVQIPKEERDKHLGEKLWAERSGILNWMVEGLLSYLEGGLREPAAVMDATAEYREESDPLGHFLMDACVVTGDAGDSEMARDLVMAFNFWMDERGAGQWKDRTISLQLKDKMRRWVSPRTGQKFIERKSNGVMRYDGIRFNDTFGARFRDAPKDHQGRPVVGVRRPADADR